MNSAPAVLRMPKLDMDLDSDDELECYPWAVNTPETSPRWREVAPSMDHAVKSQPPSQVSPELMRSVCTPYFEEMCCSVSMQQMPAKSEASYDELRAMCEPYFDQMVNALHQSISQSTSDSRFQPVFYHMMPYCRIDDQSTDADESCASFPVLSGGFSERPRSRDSETSGSVEKSPIVWKQLKSKGFCRLESKCKFLHTEHKCGIDLAASNASVTGGQLDITARPKKRGGRNRANRGQEQPSIEQEVA